MSNLTVEQRLALLIREVKKEQEGDLKEAFAIVENAALIMCQDYFLYDKALGEANEKTTEVPSKLICGCGGRKTALGYNHSVCMKCGAV